MRNDAAHSIGGGLKMQMVKIPAGSFLMGSPDSEMGRSSDETQHRVRISKPFWMGKYPVMQGQWEAVMGRNPSHFKNAGRDAPVEQVSWDDCQEFICKVNALVRGGGFRLPTEAEREYACRAGTKTPFHYGDSLDATMANFQGNYPYGRGRKGEYRKQTTPVGSFKPNAWGLYDMHGNVLEWCWDRYGRRLRGVRLDPTGPESGSDRVVRGGAWNYLAWYCRSAERGRRDPSSRDFNLGFRLARTA